MKSTPGSPLWILEQGIESRTQLISVFQSDLDRTQRRIAENLKELAEYKVAVDILKGVK